MQEQAKGCSGPCSFDNIVGQVMLPVVFGQRSNYPCLNLNMSRYLTKIYADRRSNTILLFCLDLEPVVHKIQAKLPLLISYLLLLFLNTIIGW